MTTLNTLAIVAALFAGGTSLAMAQNGPATGGEPPVAGGAAGNPAWGSENTSFGTRHRTGIHCTAGICWNRCTTCA